MKVKELFLTVCLLLGNETLAKRIETIEAESDDPEVKKLIAALNLITEELSEWTVNPEFSEELTSNNGKFFYSSFSFPLYKLKKVEFEGRSISFKAYPDRLETSTDKITVTYSYLFPKITSLSDEAKICSLLGERTVAYGVAAEYQLIAGLFGEAVTLRNRFEDGVSSYILSRRSPKIPKRSWL